MSEAQPRAQAAYSIETVDLGKRYGEVSALTGLSLRVPRGSVFGFLGPNGAGKTTSVKLLLGLARPTSGHGQVLDAPLGDRKARRRIGYLPELFRYQDWLSAREVLGVHAGLMELERSRIRAESERVLTLTGLKGRADSRVGTFSKGMQQRLGLAVALLGDPDLVFLDEPTSALDPVGRHDVREILHALKERGTTVFLNSHLLSEVEQTCDAVAVVKGGRVVAAGPLDELLGQDLVRVRATGLDDQALASLSGFGPLVRDEEWLVLRDLPQERIPDLIERLIALGGRIYAVEPMKQTLEQRFLGLLAEES